MNIDYFDILENEAADDISHALYPHLNAYEPSSSLDNTSDPPVKHHGGNSFKATSSQTLIDAGDNDNPPQAHAPNNYHQCPTPASSSSPASATNLKGYDPNAPPFDFFTQNGFGPLDQHPDIVWRIEEGVYRAYRLSTLKRDPTVTPHLISPVNGDMVVNRSKLWLETLKQRISTTQEIPASHGQSKESSLEGTNSEQPTLRTSTTRPPSTAMMPPPRKPLPVASNKRKAVDESDSTGSTSLKRKKVPNSSTKRPPLATFRHSQIEVLGPREIAAQVRGRGGKRKAPQRSEDRETNKRRKGNAEDKSLPQVPSYPAAQAFGPLPRGHRSTKIIESNRRNGPKSSRGWEVEGTIDSAKGYDEMALRQLERGIRAHPCERGTKPNWLPMSYTKDGNACIRKVNDETVRPSSRSSIQIPQRHDMGTSSSASTIAESQYRSSGRHPYHSSREYLDRQSNLVAQCFTPVNLDNYISSEHVQTRHQAGATYRQRPVVGPTTGIADDRRLEQRLETRSHQSPTCATRNKPQENTKLKRPLLENDSYQTRLPQPHVVQHLSRGSKTFSPEVPWFQNMPTQSHPTCTGHLLDDDSQVLFFNRLADVIASDTQTAFTHQEPLSWSNFHDSIF
ncbi:MAG: hypothetical protein Q9222_002742 [Ikaeria aurantiellina]